MSTPLFQEALIEAKKLREAATLEAKNAVLEAVSPLIKQMIDREISGVILEQEEPETAPADMPPPPPAQPAPMADAGATGPVEPVPAGGAEAASPSSMPGMEPAVSKAAPPIVAPEGTSVPGKFETDPATGQPTIVLNINDLFTKTAPEAAMATGEVPPTDQAPAPESLDASAPPPGTGEAPAGPPAEVPAEGEEEATQQPASLAEIYRAVNKLIAEQKKTKTLKEQAAPAAAPPVTPVPNAAAPVVDPATAAAPPALAAPPTPGVDANAMIAGAAPPAAAPATPPPAPAAATAPVPGAAPPAAPADPNAAAVPGAPPPAAPAPGVTPPTPVTEYRLYKDKLEQVEEAVNKLNRPSADRSAVVKEAYQKEMLTLYRRLLDLKKNNAISSRVFALNEERLDLLHENLNTLYSYNQIPTKGKHMRTKDSLKDFARSLFEGAEGFEKQVGHVDPAGDSEGGSAEHAHKVSGNPKKEKATAEKAPFSTKEKSEWPGKPAPTSLLEQLEEEIAEIMGQLHGESDEDEGMHMESDEDEGSEMEEAILEMDEEEVMAEARRARARIRKLREQAEEAPDGDDDKLTLTIDLDGVHGSEVSNVNVSLNGEELDVDMGGEEEGGGEEEEADLDLDGASDEEAAPEGEEEEEEEEEEEAAPKEEEGLMHEVRRQVRKALKGKATVNESSELRKQLQETRLLTARSLYLNKIFVRDDLSGTQKRKIVEYLDSARTIAEAKEVYNRVVRVLNTASKGGSLNESVARPARTLNESVEPNFDTSRWQILAGVKKTAK